MTNTIKREGGISEQAGNWNLSCVSNLANQAFLTD